MFAKGELLKRLNVAVLLAGGVLLVLGGLWFAQVNYDFLQGAERAPGEVVEVVAKRGVRGATLYYPVVRFRPRSRDEAVEFTAKPGLWPGLFEAGEVVAVAYRPAEPADAKIVSFWMLWFLPAVTVLFGLACIYAGLDIARRIAGRRA